jgi:hypothetical protein
MSRGLKPNFIAMSYMFRLKLGPISEAKATAKAKNNSKSKDNSKSKYGGSSLRSE